MAVTDTHGAWRDAGPAEAHGGQAVQPSGCYGARVPMSTTFGWGITSTAWIETIATWLVLPAALSSANCPTYGLSTSDAGSQMASGLTMHLNNRFCIVIDRTRAHFMPTSAPEPPAPEMNWTPDTTEDTPRTRTINIANLPTTVPHAIPLSINFLAPMTEIVLTAV